jgi:hypothetical protein
MPCPYKEGRRQASLIPQKDTVTDGGDGYSCVKMPQRTLTGAGLRATLKSAALQASMKPAVLDRKTQAKGSFLSARSKRDTE